MKFLKKFFCQHFCFGLCACLGEPDSLLRGRWTPAPVLVAPREQRAGAPAAPRRHLVWSGRRGIALAMLWSLEDAQATTGVMRDAQTPHTSTGTGTGVGYSTGTRANTSCICLHVTQD